MKKELIILLIIFYFPSFICRGQETCTCPEINSAGVESLLSGEVLPSSATLPDLVTFFNREWLTADIYLENGIIIKNQEIRYNCQLDELYCRESLTGLVLRPDRELIRKFHYINFQGDTAVWFHKLRIKKELQADSSDIYARLIYNGDISLFKLYSMFFDRRDVVRMNNSYFLKDIYEEDPDFFLRYSNGRTSEFKVITRKSLLEIFPGKDEQIRKFFREASSFRLKKDADLINLMHVLNSE